MQTFNKAAKGYDQHAHIQRHIGHMLLEKIFDTPFTMPPKHIADLGSGTGWLSVQLHKHWPDSHIVAIDLAHDMNKQHKHTAPNMDVCTADITHLPLQKDCMDLITSNLAWHWLQAPDTAMEKLFHTLKHGGVCHIATLGPKTLYELADAWKVIDDHPHINAYPSAEAMLGQMQKAGFKDIVADTLTFEVTYQHPKDIMRQLKGIGANTLLTEDRRRGLMTPRQAKRLWQAYEAYRLPDGRYYATFEGLFITGTKPAIGPSKPLKNCLNIPINVEKGG